MSMRADDNNVEQNITSSDVEFLEGEDKEKMSYGKTIRKTKGAGFQENTCDFIDKARHALTTSKLDLSGLQDDGDVDMNNIMLVPDQMIDKGTYYFITHSPVDSIYKQHFDSTAVKWEDCHSQLRYVESWEVSSTNFQVHPAWKRSWKRPDLDNPLVAMI